MNWPWLVRNLSGFLHCFPLLVSFGFILLTISCQWHFLSMLEEPPSKWVKEITKDNNPIKRHVTSLVVIFFYIFMFNIFCSVSAYYEAHRSIHIFLCLCKALTVKNLYHTPIITPCNAFELKSIYLPKMYQVVGQNQNKHGKDIQSHCRYCYWGYLNSGLRR